MSRPTWLRGACQQGHVRHCTASAKSTRLGSMAEPGVSPRACGRKKPITIHQEAAMAAAAAAATAASNSQGQWGSSGELQVCFPDLLICCRMVEKGLLPRASTCKLHVGLVGQICLLPHNKAALQTTTSPAGEGAVCLSKHAERHSHTADVSSVPQTCMAMSARNSAAWALVTAEAVYSLGAVRAEDSSVKQCHTSAEVQRAKSGSLGVAGTVTQGLPAGASQGAADAGHRPPACSSGRCC